MQNLRNKNIPMYCLICGVRATYLYGNTNKFRIIDIMETPIIYKGTMDKSVLVKGVRDNKMPKQRNKEELETKIDTKRIQEFYIHNMVLLVEHIIWLKERKKKEAKEEGKRRQNWI